MHPAESDHLVTHIVGDRAILRKEILVAVGETDSLIRLAVLDQEKISTEWIFYKKTFKFVNRKRMIVTTTV